MKSILRAVLSSNGLKFNEKGDVMAKDVGVFVNHTGVTASLYEEGKICVYRRQQGVWKIIREQVFGLEKSRGMREMRSKIAEALDFLADCKIFVALSVVGLPYFEMEKAHISVWEFEGNPLDFLDYIISQEKAAQEQDRHQGIYEVPVPVERSNGYYSISIKDIQENNTGITSKQVLLPFIRKGGFYELEIICSHVPPWLEMELDNGSLTGAIQKIDARETKVIIERKCCEA